MIPTKTINLDFWRYPTEVLNLVQGESAGRTLRFNLVDGTDPFDLTNATAAWFAVRKSDETVSLDHAVIIDPANGIVEVTFSSQSVAAAGDAIGELQILTEESLTKSFNIPINIQQSVDTDGISPSVTELGVLQTLIGQAETVISIANTDLWPEVVENAQYFSDLAGPSRTTETVKGNADEIADVAGAGRTTETVKGNADEIQKRALTLNNGALTTVTDNNQYYPLLSNVAGTLLATHQINVWNGSAWSAVNNYGFGHSALQNNTGAHANGFGYLALANNTGTNANGVGYSALQNNTGTNANGFGYLALANNTGTNANGFGLSALSSNTGAYSNGVGHSALSSNTGEASNGFGHSALSSNTGEASNGFGHSALQNNTGAHSNGVGRGALQNNTGAYANGVGRGALQNNTGAYANGFGHLALSSNTGTHANGFGSLALSNNTGAASNGFGYSALSSNTGTHANGFGHYALSNNTGEASNGFGSLALAYNQTLKNTAIGNGANGAFLTNAAGAKTCADTDINTTDKRATITAHGFGAANAVVNLKYTATTGTAIGGLALDTIFQAKIIDANTIEFVNGSTKRNLTSAGTGTHTFTPQFAYENTTCLGASTVPNKSNQVVLGDTLVDTVKMGGTARTPASATATGVKGEMCWDANYIYICVATNTWKRSELSTW